MLARLLIALLFFTGSLKTLYNSLDPFSVTEQLAFYELYPDAPEGKKALARAWQLLSGGQEEAVDFKLPPFDIQAIISLVTRQPFDPPVKLDQEHLGIIDKLSQHFKNRELKGAHVWTKEEVLALPSEEIDLARGLLLFQMETQEEVRQYEANIDLIALQISSRLSKEASSEEKVRAINRFIFQEMQFRFPPHSLYVDDVDLYTFLPSVLDSRQGVCLGVSILYLALAQRLDLPLEIITPPGHIYVRYHEKDTLINIETTARGINLPSEVYLGINTRKLEERTMKQVIGMAFVNEASVYWGKQDYQKTISLYEKAKPFLPDDQPLKLFMGLNYLFTGNIKEGKKYLKMVRNTTFDSAVSPDSLAEDYLSGRVDIEGLKAVFLSVDETRDSVLKKQQELEKILQRYPKFRAGLLQLATTYLQLGRNLEAQNVLENYHRLDPNDATVEYYLSIIALERRDYNKAWCYLQNAEALTSARNHSPHALKSLRHSLQRLSPSS
jgi:tetratricopeptide (TPR) repeat protein